TGIFNSFQSVPIDERQVAVTGEVTGSNHRLEVAFVGGWCAGVVEDVSDQRFLTHALIIHLDCTEDRSFGLDVLNIHHQPGECTTVVYDLSRSAGEANEFAVVEDRLNDRNVW